MRERERERVERGDKDIEGERKGERERIERGDLRDKERERREERAEGYRARRKRGREI